MCVSSSDGRGELRPCLAPLSRRLSQELSPTHLLENARFSLDSLRGMAHGRSRIEAGSNRATQASLLLKFHFVHGGRGSVELPRPLATQPLDRSAAPPLSRSVVVVDGGDAEEQRAEEDAEDQRERQRHRPGAQQQLLEVVCAREPGFSASVAAGFGCFGGWCGPSSQKSSQAQQQPASSTAGSAPTIAPIGTSTSSARLIGTTIGQPIATASQKPSSSSNDLPAILTAGTDIIRQAMPDPTPCQKVFGCKRRRLVRTEGEAGERHPDRGERQRHAERPEQRHRPGFDLVVVEAWLAREPLRSAGAAQGRPVLAAAFPKRQGDHQHRRAHLPHPTI